MTVIKCVCDTCGDVTVKPTAVLLCPENHWYAFTCPAGHWNRKDATEAAVSLLANVPVPRVPAEALEPHPGRTFDLLDLARLIADLNANDTLAAVIEQEQQ